MKEPIFPPKAAISLTKEADKKAYSGEGLKKRVSISGAKCLLILANLKSHCTSQSEHSPRMKALAPFGEQA